MTPTILLVEDDSDEAELFALAAQEAGIDWPIRRARNGEEALALLTDGRLRPALALVDLKMPGIGGLETLRRIRGDGKLKSLPVFILTSSDLAEDRAAAHAAGCDAYFIKPIGFESYVELASRIKAALPPREDARSLDG